jgi:hypothetical protein
MIEISRTSNLILRSAVLDGPYRYELRTIWDDALPKIVAIGLNPPKANDMETCVTLSALNNFARRNRFGGVVMLNLYAWRATRPADLFAASRRGENIIGDFNSFEMLRARIESNYGDNFNNTVVACWGSHGLKRGNAFLGFLGPAFVGAYVRAFGFNRDRTPIHPLHKTLSLSLAELPK